MNTIDTQVDRAADGMEAQLAIAKITAENKPQTPFPTSLVVDVETEERMVTYALQRVEQLENEMGRVINADEGSAPDENTWMGKRELFTKRYENDVRDRALTGGELFKHSNITAALSQRIVMQMIARANNFFFGTEPWYSCNFIGVEDRALADKVDRHSKWKFSQTGLRRIHEQATEFAFVRGEAVVKTTYRTIDRHFKRKGKALYDGKNIVLDRKQNPILAADAPPSAWVAEVKPGPVTPEDAAQGLVASMVPTGKQVLRRDPSVVMPDGAQWVDGYHQFRQRLFDGPESKLIHYKDFLCPLSAPTIHDADFIAHLYDMPAMDLVQMFRREDLAEMDSREAYDSMRLAVNAIRNAAGAGIDPKSGANQPRAGEGGNRSTEENPLSEVVEAYMRFDADGDGVAEEIMIVIDKKNKIPLFYDYLDNVTPKGRRPVECIRAKAIDGRWYGMGGMEYFRPEQEPIDLFLNRRNFRTSSAGAVTFWNPAGTIEGQNNPSLKLNNGKTYTKREGWKTQDILERVYLQDDTSDLIELITLFMQFMQLKSGVINAGDQQSASMPTSDTATGIRNVEKSGQEMFAGFLSSLESGHQDLLLANIRVLYAYISEPELFRFFNSKTNELENDTLDPEDVRDMEFDVKILLTRVHTEQVLQMSAEARALINEFYQTMPNVQPIVSQFYRDSLKALGFNNADELIVPQMAPVMGTPGAPATPQGGQPAEGKNLTVPSAPTPRPAQADPMI